MLFEHCLSAFALIGVLGIIAYGYHTQRRDVLVRVRTKALNDAFDALAGLEDVATRTADSLMNQPKSKERDFEVRARRMRAYYYGRSKLIVASIPIDRV
jgi:hypothetical protein